ncbi:iron ABC transporter permease [Stomatohabitans albus]|uniref:FecCD family ABC transporter permease n=1 Tax=Stomatohabitans albus TaxID=3110766 RepID=UPI00300CB778
MKRLVVIAGLIAALIVSAILALGVGSVSLPTHEVITVIAGHLGLNAGAPSDQLYEQIVWELRAPRIVAALAVGSILAVAGAGLQRVTRNILADPYLLGISSGASVGAVTVIVFGVGQGAGPMKIVMFVAALLGGLGALGMVMLLVGGRLMEASGTRTILAGVVVGQLCAAYVSLAIMVFATKDAAVAVLNWTMGSFAGVRWGDAVITIGVGIISAIAGIWLIKPLDAMALGDTSAASLGINVERTRSVVLIGSALVASVTVATVGPIGFIGLIIPHIVRMIFGGQYAAIMVLSPLLGALFMLWSDTASRALVPSREIPVGVVTAVVGAPLLAWLIWRRGGRP